MSISGTTETWNTTSHSKEEPKFRMTQTDIIYTAITASTSGLSILGGFGIVFIYFLFKDLRTSGRKLVVFISAMDALTAIGNVLGVVWLLCRTSSSCRSVNESMAFCKFHAALTIFSSISSFFWIVVIGACLLVSVVYNQPSFAKNHMVKFCVVCWTFPGMYM